MGFAYEPIIASGINACCLHYNKNNSICQNGELILMDVAAEYANYKSDMTRTVPVNGKFTKRQFTIYNVQCKVILQPVCASTIPSLNRGSYNTLQFQEFKTPLFCKKL